jgi:hypothetical protein
LDVRPRWFPLSRSSAYGCGAWDIPVLSHAWSPSPSAIVLGRSMKLGCLRFDHQAHHRRVRGVRVLGVWLTLTNARVPLTLDLMPTVWGYPQGIGGVRTRLPYHAWYTSCTLRHGLAPRPRYFMASSIVVARLWTRDSRSGEREIDRRIPSQPNSRSRRSRNRRSGSCRARARALW